MYANVIIRRWGSSECMVCMRYSNDKSRTGNKRPYMYVGERDRGAREMLKKCGSVYVACRLGIEKRDQVTSIE